MSFYFRQQIVSSMQISREKQTNYKRFHAKTKKLSKKHFFLENFKTMKTLEEKIPISFEAPHNSMYSVV